MTSPWPNPPQLPHPPRVTVPNLGCGHLPGECEDLVECAYWRGVVLGEYELPAGLPGPLPVTPEGEVTA